MFKTKTHNAYIIIMINKESYIKKKSHKDSIRIVITHEDCGNIEIQNNLWYNVINSTNLNLSTSLLHLLELRSRSIPRSKELGQF